MYLNKTNYKKNLNQLHIIIIDSINHSWQIVSALNNPKNVVPFAYHMFIKFGNRQNAFHYLQNEILASCLIITNELKFIKSIQKVQ